MGVAALDAEVTAVDRGVVDAVDAYNVTVGGSDGDATPNPAVAADRLSCTSRGGQRVDPIAVRQCATRADVDAGPARDARALIKPRTRAEDEVCVGSASCHAIDELALDRFAHRQAAAAGDAPRDVEAKVRVCGVRLR